MVLLPLFCAMLTRMAHRVVEFICSPEGCGNVSEVVAVFYTVCIQALLFIPYKLSHWHNQRLCNVKMRSNLIVS